VLRTNGTAASAGRIWSTDPSLELSHYTALRPFPLHLHAAAIVAVIVEGAETVQVDGRPELADTGSIVVLEPDRPHLNEPIVRQGARYRGFYLESPLLAVAGDDEPLAAHVLHDVPLARALVDLHRGMEEHPSPDAVTEAKRVVVEMFRRLPRTRRPVPVSQEIRHIAQILRERCAERLSWANLARDADAGASHLARRFRAERGVPPHLYQTQFRIDRAKRLPKTGTPLAVTASECGFCDQSHFSHQFFRYVGQTPGAFARAQNSTRQ